MACPAASGNSTWADIITESEEEIYDVEDWRATPFATIVKEVATDARRWISQNDAALVRAAERDIVWEEVGNNRWEAKVSGETVKVTLQSRPISRGDWQNRWVWEGSTLICEGWFDSFGDAMDDAEKTYLD